MQLDRCVIYDAIAVGGMATVYFARQRGAAGFRKAVAIKRMRPDLVHEKEFVDLFVDEARLASRVRRCPSRSRSSSTSSTACMPRTRVARAAGQLHRTDDGKTRGKAAYSAPEQLRRGEAGRTVDVFAASAVLWEILVGRRLFEGDSQAAVVSAVLGEPIDPPGLHRPELPEELDALVLRGLDRDPKRRPATALELATELETIVPRAGPSVVSAWVRSFARADLEKREAVMRRIESGLDEAPATAPPSRPVRPVRPVRPARRWALPLLFLALVAIGGVAATRTGSTPPPPAPTSSAPPAATPSTADPPAPSSAPPITRPPTTAIPTTANSHPKPTRTAPSGTPSGTRKCDPPYDLDSAGRKIFRVECL